jgi:hypothetical protein
MEYFDFVDYFLGIIVLSPAGCVRATPRILVNGIFVRCNVSRRDNRITSDMLTPSWSANSFAAFFSLGTKQIITITVLFAFIQRSLPDRSAILPGRFLIN